MPDAVLSPEGYSSVQRTHTLLPLSSQLAELTITNSKIVVLISAMHDKNV